MRPASCAAFLTVSGEYTDQNMDSIANPYISIGLPACSDLPLARCLTLSPGGTIIRVALSSETESVPNTVQETALQFEDLLHLLVRELEVEDSDVFREMVPIRRFWYRYHVRLLDQPAKRDL
jgi:hypothetical protein